MTAAFSKERGSSLPEVLVASAIVAILMVGILQIYSAALLMDYGSAGRTEMTFKAQQVVEILRWVAFLRKNSQPEPANSGIPNPPVAGTVYTLPWQSTAPDPNYTRYPFWGPAGFNVVEGEKLPYQVSYSYQAGAAGTNSWIVTVTATPRPAAAGSVPVRLYLGSGSKNKRIDYVAQIPQ